MSIPGLLRPLLCLLVLLVQMPAHAQQEDKGQALLQQLAEASRSDVQAAVVAIAESGDSRARDWLDAYGNNRLSVIKDTGKVVIVTNNRGRDWSIQDPLTGDSLGEMSRRELDRISINNALRTQLASLLAMMDLDVKDQKRRYEAASGLLGEVDASMVAPLQARIEKEQDSDVRGRLELALAIYRVEQGDVEAVSVLSGRLHPEARAALNNAVATGEPAMAAAAS
ncbi:MAG TPA: urea ABC transporter permease subunit UrtB, partial [Marinobacter sp.]|nr:urea ABC transporter permease subunit UrtB [Marinobacter sp.]